MTSKTPVQQRAGVFILPVKDSKKTQIWLNRSVLIILPLTIFHKLRPRFRKKSDGKATVDERYFWVEA